MVSELWFLTSNRTKLSAKLDRWTVFPNMQTISRNSSTASINVAANSSGYSFAGSICPSKHAKDREIRLAKVPADNSLKGGGLRLLTLNVRAAFNLWRSMCTSGRSISVFISGICRIPLGLLDLEPFVWWSGFAAVCFGGVWKSNQIKKTGFT